MRYLFAFFILFCSFQFQAGAQDYSALGELNTGAVKVYYSSGKEIRALAIVPRVKTAYDYYQQLLDFKPEVTLLVLSPTDWSKYTTFPVYGMPHYANDKTLVVASDDNPFWKSFVPPMEQLAADLRKQVESAYQKESGGISMQPFFDLLALHELGHAFHFQAGINMQRKWMGELFVNMLLHTYVAEKEPASLAALTLFPHMVINSGSKEFKYKSLEDIEAHYEEIGKQHPKNYGWYQSRWHAAAASIYDAAGKEVSRKLWDGLRNRSERLDDAALLAYLDSVGAGEVARMVREWRRE